MRISGPLARLMLYAVCGGGMPGALWPAAAAAQERTAAIRVHATVRGITDTDLLGAHAMRAAPSGTARTGAAAESGAWRIMSGRRSAVGIRVDGGAGVTICETPADAAETCAPYRAPRVATRAEGALPELVVRVRPAAAGEAVRLTVAFIDF